MNRFFKKYSVYYSASATLMWEWVRCKQLAVVVVSAKVRKRNDGASLEDPQISALVHSNTQLSISFAHIGLERMSPRSLLIVLVLSLYL